MSLIFSREAFRLAISRPPPRPRLARRPRSARLDAAGGRLGRDGHRKQHAGCGPCRANPLTAHFGVVHGQAVGMMLPHVVRFNARDPWWPVPTRNWPAPLNLPCPRAPEAAAEHLARRMESLLDLAGLPRTLEHCGAKPRTSLAWLTRRRASGRLNSTREWSPPLTSRISIPRPSRPLEAPVNKSLLLYPLILIVFDLGMFVAVQRGFIQSL